MGFTVRYIGASADKVDVISKVTGEARFAGDIAMPGMLFGKVLRSRVAHANIKRIHTEKAEALPGVEAVLTYLDAPDLPYTSTGHPYPDDTPLDMLILDRKVRFVGDTVAAVAAATPGVARQALDLIGGV